MSCKSSTARYLKQKSKRSTTPAVEPSAREVHRRLRHPRQAPAWSRLPVWSAGGQATETRTIFKTETMGRWATRVLLQARSSEALVSSVRSKGLLFFITKHSTYTIRVL